MGKKIIYKTKNTRVIGRSSLVDRNNGQTMGVGVCCHNDVLCIRAAGQFQNKIISVVRISLNTKSKMSENKTGHFNFLLTSGIYAPPCLRSITLKWNYLHGAESSLRI